MHPSVRDHVWLNTPNNPRLHGAEATVSSLEEWGAHVETRAAGSGRFRALWEEMESLSTFPQEYVQSGYTGDICDKCGGARMLRAGACLLCQDCGSSSGCS